MFSGLRCSGETLWMSKPRRYLAGGLERDGGEIRERGVVAQARGGEKLVEDRLFRADEHPTRTTVVSDADASARTHVLHRRIRTLLSRFFLFLLDQPRDRHDFIVGLDINQADALGCATNRANAACLHPENHALLRDKQ